jgi:hypothetical protein
MGWKFVGNKVGKVEEKVSDKFLSGSFFPQEHFIFASLYDPLCVTQILLLFFLFP